MADNNRIYGIKVVPEISKGDIDAEELRKAIQEALDAHTKDNPIIIKDFTATKDKKKYNTVRSAIQSALDNATKDKKVMVKHFGAQLLADDKRKIVSALNAQLKDEGLTLKVKHIEANDAVKQFRAQLTNILSGLSITGLKEFLGTEGVEATYQKAADAAEKLASAQDGAKKKVKETNAELEKLGHIKTSLGGVYRSILAFDDADVRTALSDQIKKVLEDIKKVQNATGDEQVRLAAEIENTIAQIKREAEAHKEVEDAAKKKAKAIRDAGGEEAYNAQQAEKEADKEEKKNRQKEAAAKKEETHQNKILELRKKIENTYNSNQAGFDALGGDKVENWIKELNGEADVSDDRIKQIKNEFLELSSAVTAASIASSSLFGQISTLWDRLKGFYTTIKSMNFVVDGFRKMYSAVKDLDAAMTELRKVTDLTK